ncbi:M48 family metallopeptidase [Natronococcus occultus]|uniref:Zn-dependent protease with chaperone function n=2 Tax=Natronococcus occultus TaxID=29288 RepID=L0JU63_9EURY|nr:Zn-dependent protease with chaperone function [Natronococcus occultus SP4]
MAIASTLSLALVAVVAVAGLVLVGAPIAGFVWYAVALLGPVLSTSVATVLAVVAAVLAVLCVEWALRALRTARTNPDTARPGPLAEGVVEFAAYVLLLSSLLVALALAPVVSAALPGPVFAALVLAAGFYLLTISYVWAAREWTRSRSDADDRLERSAAGNWLVAGVFGVGYLSFSVSELFAGVLVIALVGIGLAAAIVPDRLDDVRARLVARAEDDSESDSEHEYYGITDERRRLAARLKDAPPVILAGFGVLVGLVVVSVATTALSTAAIAAVVGTILALAFVGGHVASVVRSEFDGEAAVVRNLEQRVELESLADAREDDPALAELQTTVARLAGQADVPVPELRLAETEAPAALTVGYRPSSSTIVLSRGLVDTLEDRELEAVVAHELAHVANRDAAVLTALATPGAVARAATGRYGFNPVLEPLSILASRFGRAAVAVVARGREYAADDGAVAITGDPAALAGALETLDAELERRPSTDLRSREPTTAFSIVPPPWEKHRFFDRTQRLLERGVFGTHPSTEKRIDRLRAAVSNDR